LFVTWFWRFKIFQKWLVPFPYLAGSWKGELITVFKSDELVIPLKIIIEHNYFTIQIKFQTNESKSVSICGMFDIDKDRGLRHIVYSFLNLPNTTVRDRSAIHYGTARLEISDDARTLEGEYWTSRKTTGHMKLVKN